MGQGRLLFRGGLRSLLRHPIRTALIVSCTALGVAAMIGTFAVNEQVLGAFDAVRRAGSGSAPLKVTGPSGVPYQITRQVAAVDGVLAAIPVASTMVPLADGGGALMVLGLAPGRRDLWLESQPDADLRVRPDLMIGLEPWVILDRRGAERLGMDTGDRIEIVGPSGVAPLRIAGTFDAGALSDASGGYMALTTRAAAATLAGCRSLCGRARCLHASSRLTRQTAALRLVHT